MDRGSWEPRGTREQGAKGLRGLAFPRRLSAGDGRRFSISLQFARRRHNSTQTDGSDRRGLAAATLLILGNEVRGRLRSGKGAGRSLPGGLRKRVRRERKVRTPQGSVPDNVRDAGVKARGRQVPQKTYRRGFVLPQVPESGPGAPRFVLSRTRFGFVLSHPKHKMRV
jgi:hypothetical protein